MDKCPCGSERSYPECCEPLIKGDRTAETPEQLMRSRYSAYVHEEIDYLHETLHPDQRKDYDVEQTRKWAKSSQWLSLEIINTEKGGPEDTDGLVEFIASYRLKGERRKHHELASFIKEDGKWYFEKGEGVTPAQVVRTVPKMGRNDPCHCGSGQKYKKCCGKNS